MIWRKIGTLLIGLVSSALVLGSLTGAVGAHASAPPFENGAIASAQNSRSDKLAERPAEKFPEVLTDTEMNTLIEGKAGLGEEEFEFTGTPPSAQSNARAAKKSPSCKQDTGRVWVRKSGRGHPYGTVGGKPSITCNLAVTKISLSTTIYQKRSRHWRKVAGPFINKNHGAKSLTQKSVEYVCKKASSKSHFRIVAHGSVTFPGLRPIAGGAYSDTTNPGVTCG